jgi:hypothetical protein
MEYNIYFIKMINFIFDIIYYIYIYNTMLQQQQIIQICIIIFFILIVLYLLKPPSNDVFRISDKYDECSYKCSVNKNNLINYNNNKNEENPLSIIEKYTNVIDESDDEHVEEEEITDSNDNSSEEIIKKYSDLNESEYKETNEIEEINNIPKKDNTDTDNTYNTDTDNTYNTDNTDTETTNNKSEEVTETETDTDTDNINEHFSSIRRRVLRPRRRIVRRRIISPRKTVRTRLPVRRKITRTRTRTRTRSRSPTRRTRTRTRSRSPTRRTRTRTRSRSPTRRTRSPTRRITRTRSRTPTRTRSRSPIRSSRTVVKPPSIKPSIGPNFTIIGDNKDHYKLNNGKALVVDKICFGNEKNCINSTFLNKKGPRFTSDGENLKFKDGKSVVLDNLCFGEDTNCIDPTTITNILTSASISKKLEKRVSTYLNFINNKFNYMFSSDINNYEITSDLTKILNTSVIPIGEYMQLDKTPESLFTIITSDSIDIKVPLKYNIIWLRVPSDIYTHLNISTNSYNVNFSFGKRRLNVYSPDGSGTNDYNLSYYIWAPLPIPIEFAGSTIKITPINESILKLSGVAFSINPWYHVSNSAVAFSSGINKSALFEINKPILSDDSEHSAFFTHGKKWNIAVPVIPSGKDKLLYIIVHNDNNDGISHTNVYVNNIKVERLHTSYINPFSIHFNSGINTRYIALRIPEKLINKETLLSVTINLKHQKQAIRFREIGTHDFYKF